jgi:hypothetical protein
VVGCSMNSWNGDGVGVSVPGLGKEQADEIDKVINTAKYNQKRLLISNLRINLNGIYSHLFDKETVERRKKFLKVA